MDSLLSDIFINDLFYNLGDSCDLYNWADDNNISVLNKDVWRLKSQLETSAGICVNWFENNLMGVNPSKFQGFLIDRNNGFAPTMFNLTDVDIPISDTVKILGVQN